MYSQLTKQRATEMELHRLPTSLSLSTSTPTENENGDGATRPYDGIAPFPHQIVMTNAMRALEKKREGTDCMYDCGLLSSIPGSGKTLSTVLLAVGFPSVEEEASMKLTKPRLKICLQGRAVHLDSKMHDVCLEGTLIVVPSSIVHQWKDCILRMANVHERDLVCFTRFDAPERLALESTSSRVRDRDDVIPRIVLMTSTAYVNFIKYEGGAMLDKFIFQRVVYDEADTLKIPGFKFVDAHFTWFVTGSPERFYTNNMRSTGMKLGATTSPSYSLYGPPPPPLSDRYGGRRHPEPVCGDLFQDIATWKSLTVSCEPSYVEEALSLPPLERHTVHVKCRAFYDALRPAVPEEALEALEAGDVVGAIEIVGCTRVTSQEGLISAVTAQLKAQITNLVARRLMYENGAWNEDEEDVRLLRIQEIDATVQNIRQNIERIRRRVQEADNVCPITMDDIRTPATAPCCQNTFEWRALLNAIEINRRCPMCRHTPLRVSDIIVRSQRRRTLPREQEQDDASASVPKRGTIDRPFSDVFHALRDTVRTILREDSGARIIVFSAHSMESSFGIGGMSILRAVEEGLGNDYACKIMKGTNATVQKIIHTFRQGREYKNSSSTTSNTSSALSASSASTASTASTPLSPLPPSHTQRAKMLRVLLLDAVHLGAGHNLEFATHIITLHSMPDELYRQVVGRAQRVGRTCPLKVVDIRTTTSHNTTTDDAYIVSDA